jgi:tRNA(fMet)-specific endonuclease VapC
MSFLLDTDTCSAHLKDNKTVGMRFLQYGGGLHISAISLCELLAWARRASTPPRRLIGLREMLKEVAVLPVTAEVAEQYGRLQAKLLDTGKPAPVMDLMIAATATVHDLTLVTHNSRHFANIPGLRLQDWLEP